jgi:hypothetical protein
MAKLIRSHIECGHRVIGLCLYNTDNINIIGKVIKDCQPTEEQNFPDNCPLEDGISCKEESIVPIKHYQI